MKGKQAAQQMSNFLNNMTCDEKGFIEEMAKDHRTIQQSFTSLCLQWINHLAEVEYYDGRNESAVEISREIKEKVLGDTGGRLPMI